MDERSIELKKRELVIPGSLHDHYQVGKLLGKGGFATVRYGRTRTAPEFDVALKILNPAAYTTPGQQRVALHEIEVLRMVKAIQSPNIMEFVAAHEDFSTTTNAVRLTIATRLATGGELFDDIVKHSHYSEREAAVLLSQLATALAAVHAKGIIHRDLKPENILLATKGAELSRQIPLLADFGLAKIIGGEEVHCSLVGTPGYLAPEIITSRTYTPAVDVWALGVILYIMLCGYPPFYAEDNKALYASIKQGDYEFHPDAWGSISPEARDLVSKMLSLDPLQRPTMKGVLCHPWVVARASGSHMPLAITNMKRFNARRKLRAAVLASTWASATRWRVKAGENLSAMLGEASLAPGELQQLSAAFKSAAGGSPAISLAQFQEVIAALGPGSGLAGLPVERVFHLFDCDHSGELDYRELLLGLARARSTNLEDLCTLAFQVYDTSGDGFLTLEELAQVLTATGFKAAAEAAGEAVEGGGGAAATPRTAEQRRQDDANDFLSNRISDIFSRIDQNGDRKISFDEFRSGIMEDAEVRAALLRPLKAVVDSA